MAIMGAIAAIAKMSCGFAAGFWLHRFLFSSKSLRENLNGHRVNLNGGSIPDGIVLMTIQSYTCTSSPFAASEQRKQKLNDVMEALGDPNADIVGVYGSDDAIKDTLLQIIRRRVDRDNLFDVVLTTTVTKRSSVKKIQEEIAGQLGLMFNEKSEGKRAIELRDGIKNVQKILVILCDLHRGLDLGMIGIPFGSHHRGCKILLTSTAEEVLSTHMHAQKTFMI